MAEPLRILVVEDEALVAMLIEDALLLHDHSVVGIVDTQAEALALATRERPDMALCDVRLATGDCGRAVAVALAEMGVPCLFLSGNCPDRADHPRILGCIAKPFPTAGLGHAVAAAHAHAQGRQPERVPPELHFYA
ncbi:response regulator [Sphingomonas silueang]|uniref:response regulator n=1 Tax=Sphingomonas silueang TaxID=3156617 RepID=UPI0032B3F8CB